jgi:ssDNA-binding Zn-finger/Zn-ribbon topoisomerase 1
MEINYFQCPKCKYKWYSKSQLKKITCPNCQNKVDKTKDILAHLIKEEVKS